jgi:multiple sugar transport system substrate-binding protein
MTQPVSLLGWTGSEAENVQLQQAIVSFEQSYPYWPVAGRLLPNYSLALENELESEAPPDLFLAHSHQLADMVEDGLLLPIPSGHPLAIAPNLVEAIQVGGQNYCFPRDVAVLALFYNTAVFDRTDAPYPANNWSWTEFRAALDATADINNGYYGLALDYDLSRFFPFLLQSSNDDDIWQGDDALAALEFFMDFYNDEVATTPARLDSTWNGEAFGRGRAAMTIEANWLVPYLANHFPSLTYGILELPSGPSGRGTTAFITCWVINAQTQNVEGALALASFLTSPPQLAAWADASGNLPPTIEGATAWVARHPTYAPFVASLPYATPWSGPAGFVARSETVNLSMDMWYNDNMTTPELIGVLASMSESPPLPTPTATPAD